MILARIVPIILLFLESPWYVLVVCILHSSLLTSKLVTWMLRAVSIFFSNISKSWENSFYLKKNSFWTKSFESSLLNFSFFHFFELSLLPLSLLNVFPEMIPLQSLIIMFGTVINSFILLDNWTMYSAVTGVKIIQLSLPASSHFLT